MAVLTVLVALLGLPSLASAGLLAQNRAYEKVSPANKNFGDAVPGTPAVLPTSSYVGTTGDAIAFSSANAFGIKPGQITAFNAQYSSMRDQDGWHTQRAVPNVCTIDPDDPQFYLWFIRRQPIFSADATSAAIPVRESPDCETPPLDPAAPLPADNFYRASYGIDSVAYDLLAPVLPAHGFLPSGNAVLTGEWVAASEDFNHIVYMSTADQSGDAIDELKQLFEWTPSGVRLVSKESDGDPFPTVSEPGMDPGGFGTLDQEWDARNNVSTDGSRIFFRNGEDLYMRENGTTTYEVSASECTSACGETLPVTGVWASADGGTAVLQTREKLLDSDTQKNGGFFVEGDLYLYRHSADPAADSNLHLLTLDSEPADETYNYGANVLGVSDDGNTLFFTAATQLLAGEPTTPGEKIYRWRWNGGSPVIDFLGTVAVDDTDLTIYGQGKYFERRVAHDGQWLMVESPDKVDPLADTDEDTDVYVWSAATDWQCISCQDPGTASSGPSNTSRVGTAKSSVSGTERSISAKLSTAVSDDGETVFFVSQDALVPEDVNGPCNYNADLGYYPCRDVYEWHAGEISLVTPGDQAGDVGLIGTSSSGDDVFFFTRQRLLGWDTDGLVDIYDARVDGGFPEPPPLPAECEGEGCRGQGTPAPVAVGAGTAVFEGPGNQAKDVTKRCKRRGFVRRGNRCVKRRHHRKAHTRGKHRAEQRDAGGNRRFSR